MNGDWLGVYFSQVVNLLSRDIQGIGGKSLLQSKRTTDKLVFPRSAWSARSASLMATLICENISVPPYCCLIEPGRVFGGWNSVGTEQVDVMEVEERAVYTCGAEVKNTNTKNANVILTRRSKPLFAGGLCGEDSVWRVVYATFTQCTGFKIRQGLRPEIFARPHNYLSDLAHPRAVYLWRVKTNKQRVETMSSFCGLDTMNFPHCVKGS